MDKILNAETEALLEIAAHTCLAHMHYVEDAPKEEQTPDDQGLYNLEQLFLVLYSYYKKGDVPDVYKEHG